MKRVKVVESTKVVEVLLVTKIVMSDEVALDILIPTLRGRGARTQHPDGQHNQYCRVRRNTPGRKVEE